MLRVLTLNMFVGRADAELVVARVRQVEADVVFLQELSAEAVSRLKQAGLDDLMPHSRIERRAASGIYARFPLGGAPVQQAQPSAVLGLPAAKLWNWSGAPAAADAEARRRARVAEALAGLPPPGALPRVVAGDFNATQDHAVFATYCVSVMPTRRAQTGGGLSPTWGRREERPAHPRPHSWSTGAARYSTTPCTSSPAATTGPSTRKSGSPDRHGRQAQTVGASG